MKKINILMCAVTTLFMVQPVMMQAQTSKKSNLIVKVLDTTGRPIADVELTPKNSEEKWVTSSYGDAVIDTKNNSGQIYFEKLGYKTQVISLKQLQRHQTVVLKPDHLGLYQPHAEVERAFGKENMDNVAALNTTIRPAELMKNNSNRSLAGLLDTYVLGMSSGTSARGQNAVFVVDGFVRGTNKTSYINTFNAEEVEEITVLKDPTSKALYGQYADMPIIVIRTKRGDETKRDIQVNYEFGIYEPVAYAEYMNAADYMTYYNYARANDNNNVPNPLYSDEQIQNTLKGIDHVLFPDQNLLTSEFLKDRKTSHRLVTDFSGGNQVVKYYLNFGMNHATSLLNIDDNNTSNRFNVRGNLDIKVNSFIKAYVDGALSISTTNSPKFQSKNFWQMAATHHPNEYSYLIPVDRISEDNADMLKIAKRIGGGYILAGEPGYEQNPYGDLLLSGYNKNYTTYSQINFGLDFDLGFLLKGLNFNTNLAYDEYTYYDIMQQNTYAVYYLNYDNDGKPLLGSDGKLTIQRGNNKDSFTGNQKGANQDFYQRIGLSNVLSYDITKNNHFFSAKAISYLEHHMVKGTMYTDKMLNAGLNLNYAYDSKYIINGVSMLQGTPRLYNRWGTTLSGSLAWVISEEGVFDDLQWLDNLKLMGSYGNIKTDRVGLFMNGLTNNNANKYYLYQDTYKSSGGFTFLEGTNKNIGAYALDTKGNKDITWVGRRELNVGLDGCFFNNSLRLQGNYFYSQRYNDIVKLSSLYPSLLGPSEFIPYTNYGKSSYEGFEAGVTLSKYIGDFRFTGHVNFLTYIGHHDLIDELDYGPGLEHLQKQGAITDGIRGLVCEGMYTQEEVDAINYTPEHPSPQYGTVRAGDLKYKDITGDGLVNNDDKKIIGNWNPREMYTFALNVGYKNLDLFVKGNYKTGAEGDLVGNSYWGLIDGMDKYPEHVKDAWVYVPELGIDNRATAKYPRLSSNSNSNNSQTSTFWLRKNDSFNLSTIQLTYHFPQSLISKWLIRDLDVFVRADNLFVFSDEETRLRTSISAEPSYRLLISGISVNF